VQSKQIVDSVYFIGPTAKL